MLIAIIMQVSAVLISIRHSQLHYDNSNETALVLLHSVTCITSSYHPQDQADLLRHCQAVVPPGTWQARVFLACSFFPQPWPPHEQLLQPYCMHANRAIRQQMQHVHTRRYSAAQHGHLMGAFRTCLLSVLVPGQCAYVNHHEQETPQRGGERSCILSGAQCLATRKPLPGLDSNCIAA